MAVRPLAAAYLLLLIACASPLDLRTEPWQYGGRIPDGTYGIALGLELGSDVPTWQDFTPAPGDDICHFGKVVCVAEAKVTPIVERVIVTADFGSPCDLRIRTVGV